jgi:hypothetical protein
MTLDEAKALASKLSKEHECSQYVQFKFLRVVDADKAVVEGRWFVSDWYDSDITLAHYYNGREIML